MLYNLWGTCDVDTVAGMLGRSKYAVVKRVTNLGIGSQGRGKLTLSEVCRRTGFAGRSTILRLAEMANVQIQWQPGRKVRGQGRWCAITEEQYERICDVIRGLPHDGKIMATKSGEWGRCGKPPACRRCGRSDRKHCSRGLCDACYMYARVYGLVDQYPRVRARRERSVR
jgi:hypothetical protein